jgi:DNA-binding transcriptional regulator YiaG
VVLTTPARRNLRAQRSSDRPWRTLTPARIRAARASLGLNQADFALLVGRTERRGIAPDYTKVSRWERGLRRPSALWGPALLAIVEGEERKRGAGWTPPAPAWHALTPARILAARQSLGLSQAGFAAHLGRMRGQLPPSDSTISLWESGERTPGDTWGALLLKVVEQEERRYGKEGTGAGPSAG